MVIVYISLFINILVAGFWGVILGFKPKGPSKSELHQKHEKI
jgi:hypothetical protein